MSNFLSQWLIAGGVLACALLGAPAATANPGPPPCDIALSFICQFVPIAPELDGDVDLTQQHSGDTMLVPESSPPADPCVRGCI